MYTGPVKDNPCHYIGTTSEDNVVLVDSGTVHLFKRTDEGGLSRLAEHDLALEIDPVSAATADATGNWVVGAAFVAADCWVVPSWKCGLFARALLSVTPACS